MTNREIDALVAERVMGWKWYHYIYTYRQGEESITNHRSILCDPEKFQEWELKYGKSRAAGGVIDNTRVPYYITDPAADYRVLEYVRKEWATPEHDGGGDWKGFENELKKIWRARAEFYSLGDKSERTGWVEWFAQYEPGDYSCAALAALGLTPSQPTPTQST